MSLNKNIDKYDIFFFAVLVCLFFTSFNVYKDFGISIDEESTRYHGLVSYNYLLTIIQKFFDLDFGINENLPSFKQYSFSEYGVIFEKAERKGHDIYIALDVSKSMLAQDIQPSRLEHAKREILGT